MGLVIGIGSLVLAALAFRGARWAYAAFIVLGLTYFPAKVGFQLAPAGCEVAISARLAALSVTNVAHILLFALFFLMSMAQLPTARRWPFLAAAGATLTMGALVELSQGVTGYGHCRVRDLIPDGLGVVLGAAVLLAWRAMRRRLAPAQSDRTVEGNP